MRSILLLILFIAIVFPVFSQESEQETTPETVEEVDYIYDIFNAPLVVNGQSVETNIKNSLNFEIYHRFGPITNTFGGLDQQVNIRWGFSYGLTDNYTIGFGRSKYSGSWDFYGKAKVLNQSTGAKVMPISLSIYSSAVVRTTTLETGGNGGQSQGNNQSEGNC